MAIQNPRTILVYADWQELPEPTLMGTLTAALLRGKEVFSFNYSRDWLNSGNTLLQLDPELHLYTGPQYLAVPKTNFGLFTDSSPDRWGRLLMRRREAVMARLEGRKENTLFEADMLLGVYDEHRMGAIRFKVESEGAFQHDDAQMATPPFTSLRTLEEASLKLETEDDIDNPEYIRWLSMLMAPGSSLGGARPKASVVDPQQHLWIAKFPSQMDNRDTGAWEMVAHRLADLSGINVAEAFVERFSVRHHTFLTKRFDRTTSGRRIHFASAMTLLGYTDGIDHQEGVSYLELAEFIMRQGAQPTQDLEQLWSRIVFNICISNTDDHLRNHGFLLTPAGWMLSPAYDLNPIETGTGLKLNIDENDNSLEIELALKVAPYFRIDIDKANQIIAKIQAVVADWKSVATSIGISRMEQVFMERAFRNV